MKSTGHIGELIALNYLIKNNYLILTHNFFTRFGEIDIIAQKHNTIHMVEVKLQSKQMHIDSLFKLNLAKRKRMVLAAQLFIKSNNVATYFYQFDLITIDRTGIRHYKNIFNLNDA